MATDDKKLLMDMLDSSNTELRKNAALNEMADDEVLRKAYQDNNESVRIAAISNPNASSEFLQYAFDNGYPPEKVAVLQQENVSAETLKDAVTMDDELQFLAIDHKNANEEVYQAALESSIPDIADTAKQRLSQEYGWDDERFAALQNTNDPKPETAEWQPDTFTPDEWQPEQPNGLWYGDSDELITAEEINKPQPLFATPTDKANAAFEELKTHYQGYGEYDSNTGIMYLPNGKNKEMLHFDPTQERIVLSAVNPQGKGREEIADTHFTDLDPQHIALAVDRDYKEYQKTIAQNQGKFPDEEQKKTIDKAGDSVEETIRVAKSKTAKLTPPEAPPQGLTERYNAVERKFLDSKTNLRLTHRVDYVDSGNGKTVLFSDKGSKLTTAKNDPQTVNDMVEVAKAKGWTTLKLSGNKEFKRQAWLAAESQGIKTKGYSPSPQDKAMLEKMREERSLNSVEQAKKQEKTPDRQPEHTPQAEKQVEKTPQKDLSGSPKQESTPETAIQGGILLEHGAARFQFDKDKPMNYYAMLQMPNGEKEVLWGKEIEKTLQEHNAQIGDRISLQKNGYVNVRVQEPIKDKDGKTVLDENGNPKTEEVMRQRNHWDLTIFDKAQVSQEQGQPEKTIAKQDDLPQERLIKHDLMGQPERNPAELSQKVDEAIFGKRPDEDASVARKGVYTALKVKDAVTIGAGVAVGGAVGGAAAVGLVAAQNYVIDKGIQTVEKTVDKDGKTFDMESQKQQIKADVKQMFNNPNEPVGVSNTKPSLQQLKDEYEKVKTTHLDDTQRQHIGVAERYLHKSLQDCNASPQYKEFCLCNFYRSTTAEIKNGTIDIPNPYQSSSVGKSRDMGKSQTQTQTKSQSKSKGVDI